MLEKVSLSDIWNPELFADILTADDMYSVHNKENLQQPSQMQLSKKQQVFINFLLYFWNLRHNFKILKKNMSLSLWYLKS